MKKVLIVSFVTLFPVNAGNRVRIIQLIDMMREWGYDVHYLHFGSVVSNYDKHKMTNYIGKGKCWFYDVGKSNCIHKLRNRKRLKDENKSVYYDVDELIPVGLTKYVKELHKKEQFDIVVSEYVMASKVLTVFDKDVLKVIDTHDILTNRNKIFEKLGQKPTGMYLRKQQEVRGLKRADVVLAIQNKEAKVFKKWLNDSVKVYVVGNKVNEYEPHVAHSKNVLFIGSRNLLNRIAAEFCVENLAQFLTRKGAKLQVVGSVCDFLPNSDVYEKLGYVDDLTRVYKNARIVVNPIQGGTGLNIKSIEALGYAKPLITTSIGAKGLPEDVLLIADDKEGFKEKISELLTADDKVFELSFRANEFVHKYNNKCAGNLRMALQEKTESNKQKTLITVVTVCRNSEASIEKTIKSVLAQTYTEMEYLIVDGLSTDGTLKVVDKYLKDARVRVISEADSGVYNAMNKGVRYANGQYIMLLNSGDELVDKNVLADMAIKIKKEKADLVCGNWVKEYTGKTQYVYYSKNNKLRMLLGALCYYFMANHQTILVNKSYLLEEPFDESYSICADFHWYLKMLKKMLCGKMKFIILDRFIVNYKMDGLSAKKENYEKMVNECYKAVSQEFGWAKKMRGLAVKYLPSDFVWKLMHVEERK